jgi:hypothetical protein
VFSVLWYLRLEKTKEHTKTCKRCGRVIEWRRKWKNEWEKIQYCSDACRRAKISEMDERLEESIVRLLSQRAGGATICPSEAAREVFPVMWQEQMEASRQAARRLVARGWIEITQGGKVVDPSTAKGPIRLRKGREFPPI